MNRIARLLLLVVLVIAVAVTGVTVMAAPEIPPMAMAKYFPANSVIFATMTIPDESYLDTPLGNYDMSNLDSLFGPSGLNVPPPETARELFDLILEPIGTDTAAIMAWLGDSAAIGIGSINPDGTANGVYGLIEITDGAAVEGFLRGALPPEWMPGEKDGYTTFQSLREEIIIAVSDDFLLFYSDETGGLPVLSLETSLADSATFQDAVSKLPGDRYDALFYLDIPGLLVNADLSELRQMGLNLSPQTTGPLVMGSTFLDPTIGIMDIAQLPGMNAVPSDLAAVDMDFARFIPAEASAVVHATDLTRLYDSFMGTLTNIAAASGGDDPSLQFEMAFRMLGVDLRNDLLSWTTGDYALFLRADVMPIITAFAQERFDINDRLDFGLVIEATDPAKAQALVQKLTQTAMLFLGNEQGIKVTQKPINGVEVTIISISAPLTARDVFNMDIVIGATDDVFFIASGPAATAILSGESRLMDNPNYVKMNQYLLPNPTSVWYADGEGVIVGMAVPTVVVLTLLGPAIGDVFENIVNELEAPQAYYNPQPKPMFVSQTDPTAEMLRQLETMIESTGTLSISSTITSDGTTLIRIVSLMSEN
jgi:hypothetical protein